MLLANYGQLAEEEHPAPLFVGFLGRSADRATITRLALARGHRVHQTDPATICRILEWMGAASAGVTGDHWFLRNGLVQRRSACANMRSYVLASP